MSYFASSNTIELIDRCVCLTSLSKSTISQTSLKNGDCFRMGDKELGVDCVISRMDFQSRVCFGRGLASTSSAPYKPVVAPALAKKFVPVKPSIASTSSLSRGAIPLRPVNLIDFSSNEENKEEDEHKEWRKDSYWTANWYISHAPYLFLLIYSTTLGENWPRHRKSINLGRQMAT